MAQEQQWFHVETYGRAATRKTKDGGRRATIRGIVGEATREQGYCKHVEEAQEPTALLGDLHELERELLARADHPGKNGRKVRPDAHILLAGTASYPKPTKAMGPEDEDHFNLWLNKTVEFLQGEWGDKLKAVVLHLDEGFPHIHFYAADLDGLDMKALHRGKAAEAKADGHKKEAYRQAMQTYQDDYYQAVGFDMGFSRLGPRRQRLSRKEWKTQQHANQVDAAARAKARADLETQAKALDDRRAQFSDSLRENAKLREELKRAGDSLQILLKRNQEALQRAEKAEARAEEAEQVLGAVTGLGEVKRPATRSEPSPVLPFAKPPLKDRGGRGGPDFGGFGL